MRLIRLIRVLPEPAVSDAPAVLGVDEFALRHGHRYDAALVMAQFRLGRHRVYRPWVSEPGLWLQWHWGDGPVVASP